MIRKFLLLCSLVGLFASTQAEASISFLIQADELNNSAGTGPMAKTGLFLLVASTAGDGFAVASSNTINGDVSTAIGTSLSSLTGGDDRIVFKGALGYPSADGVLDANTGSLNLSSVTGWTTGDSLALLWFPDVAGNASTIPANSSYGFYTRATAADGTSAWVTPSDPTSNYLLGFFTQDGAELSPGPGAANPASAGNATLVTGVPEPSRAVLGMMGMAVLALRRRRR
ncbi:MAG: hypothetical protein ACO1TE_01785 [Prosthecobacter sp.]